MKKGTKKLMGLIIPMIAFLVLSGALFAGNETKKEGDKTEKSAKEVKKSEEEKKESVKEDNWTKLFMEEKSDLVSVGRNPFFILEPGYTLTYQEKGEGEKAQLVITVLNETKMIDGVETRIVEERETSGGELAEVSLNYFAISKRTNSVYYFGEDSKEYKNGKVISQGGSWESGVKGATYGLMMPGTVLLGGKFYQEIAPGEAMDRAEIISCSEKIEVPAGTYQNCLKTKETTPLEPKTKESKYYAPGVGLIKDKDMLLVKITAAAK
jgi:hypothetical protein